MLGVTDAPTRWGGWRSSIADRPEIFPINYVVDHGTVVFRTAEGTKLAGAVQRDVAFEADGYETADGRGLERRGERSRRGDLAGPGTARHRRPAAVPVARGTEAAVRADRPRRDHRSPVSRRRPRSLEDAVDGGTQVGTRMTPGFDSKVSAPGVASKWTADRHQAVGCGKVWDIAARAIASRRAISPVIRSASAANRSSRSSSGMLWYERTRTSIAAKSSVIAAALVRVGVGSVNIHVVLLPAVVGFRPSLVPRGHQRS